MIAIEVARDAAAGHAELLRETDTLMTTSANVARNILLRGRRVGIVVRLDGMDAVTVSANRRKLVAARQGLAVDALHEGGVHVSVALAAGSRHIEFVDGRLGVVRGDNLVCAVAVRADSSLLGALLGRAPVHTLLVADEGLCALTARFHQEFLPMAAAARIRNILVADRRFGIVRSEDLVRSAVAILAAGGRRSCSAGNRMRAVREGLLRVGVALGASDLLWWGIVCKALYVLVAIHAREETAMNRVLQFA